MAASTVNRYWTTAIVILIAVIIIGGIIAWLRYSPNQPVEITLPPDQEQQGTIYIGGAVNSPGLYPFATGDSLVTLIQAAGGTTGTANLNQLELHIPEMGEGQQSQRIDINRADVWLLESLPGIGETLAQRIADYRQQNGPFSNTNELLKVSGIGNATYENIQDLITIADR